MDEGVREFAGEHREERSGKLWGNKGIFARKEKEDKEIHALSVIIFLFPGDLN